MPQGLGKVLLVANPAAQNGRGATAAGRAAAWLRERLGDDALTLAPTSGPRHASALVERAEGYDTVIALGGDGVIHEAANGLMARPADRRPVLGVLPVGSGNDYARTLGMAPNLEKGCAQLLAAVPQAVDVGCVNGSWFVETLSFGLDSYSYELSLDGAPPVAGRSIIFAVQLGPYYGGGFKVCPDARLDSGRFDLCIAHPPVSKAKAAYIFLRAKSGGHTGFKPIEMLSAARLHVEFSQQPPAQMDGERIEGRTFDVAVHPGALRVLVPTQRR